VWSSDPYDINVDVQNPPNLEIQKA